MRHLLPLLITLSTLLVTVYGRAGAEVVYTNPYEGFNEETFMDMDFEPNLATPVVPDKEKAAVRRMMSATASALKGPFTVELMRDDEVMVVSIPTDNIFLPNDTLLTDAAERLMQPLFGLMKDPMKYKVVMAMHTDDTGNALYQERLSTARLYSVYDLFLDMIDSGDINPDIVIIPYAMGGDDPVTDNDTWRHRAINRRLELYFIPGPSLIEDAHRQTAAPASGAKKK
ncbi:MAG: hypothetical protein K2K40_10035 [Paramuribaculum sp.]|nr:hypothetical protein [Paramuribaculum sp.]MDE7152733.1 hypothetical protein [Candidatus Amulumruptor sp.]